MNLYSAEFPSYYMFTGEQKAYNSNAIANIHFSNKLKKKKKQSILHYLFLFSFI